MIQMRSSSQRLLDEDENDNTRTEPPAPVRVSSRGRNSFKSLVSPKASMRKRISRILGWRFSDIFKLWHIAHEGSRCEGGILAGVCIMAVTSQALVLSLPVYSGQIMRALTGGASNGEEADGAQLSRSFAQAMVVVAAYIALRCIAELVMMLTGIRWREALTKRLHAMYLRDVHFYKAQLFDCDNPDQRIASDVANFTKLCCGGVSPPYGSVLISLVSNVSLAVFATVMCVQRAGWNVTGICYAYNVVTIVINIFVSLPIAGSTANQEAREGDFRRSHMRVRTYAESIAFFSAGKAEQAHLDAKLKPTIENQRRLTHHYFRLLVVIRLTDEGGGLIPLVIAAVAIWSGAKKVYDIAELSAVMGTVSMLNGAVQALPGLLPEITTIAGLSKRVIGLHRVLDALDTAPPPDVRPVDRHDRMGCEKLTYRTPDGARQLARKLSVTIRPGSSVVVCGESGCGKSSLLRCLAGLWEADSGRIFRPLHTGRGGVLFLPQKPFMCVGTLRDQVTYPVRATGGAEGGEAEQGRREGKRDSTSSLEPDHFASAEDALISGILESVGLAETEQQFGLDAHEVWEDVLSLGEQQRLCFARLLYVRPAFAIMDEATSALDSGLEAVCMREAKSRSIAMLSVAHRESVIPFHEHVLHMYSDGTSELMPVADDDDARAVARRMPPRTPPRQGSASMAPPRSRGGPWSWFSSGSAGLAASHDDADAL
eukprot:CAMPEP_0185167532 /NCGR_PEP_ID=MMETSP1139-20130426/14424_1 /TAXON_ID=298111 /ORGANISM="Pavlova sp., Strain CCMP459" /LENGTH=711 /DNA_ID=CAMNT_0027733019 /DNA_START=3 /DNA_END=2138 /DNA_ORIENTATION=+